jgi:predicted nucleic acid-binding protein
MIIVDSNVILDIVTDDPVWADWSLRTLEQQKEALAINPIIYAEVSVKIPSIEQLDDILRPFKRLNLPYEAGFLAGKAFFSYKQNEGVKTNPLPDFFIGAHAAILAVPLITRDIQRYKTYFPTLKLVSPYE